MKLAKRMWVPVVLCGAAAHADPSADACAQLATVAELDPAPTNELALGDCYAQIGQTEQAAHAYRDAARRALIVVDVAHSERVVAPGQVAPVAADRGDRWRVAMWSSLAVTAVGLGAYAYGSHVSDDASTQIANHNAGTQFDFQQLEQLEQQGQHGETLAHVGLATAAVAAGFTAVALYKGYHGARVERVVVAPVVAPGTAGALLALRW